MQIDKNLIKKVARNARLDEKDAEKLLPDFKEILEFFSTLDEVNTEGVEPSIHPIKIKNVLREDNVEECYSQEDILSNTKNKKDGFFKGPKAI